MKKIIIIVVIFAVILSIQSCTKEKDITNPSETKSIFKDQLKTDHENDKSIEEKIRQFEQKMKNCSNLKESESFMDIENVEWYLEATLNFNYAEAGETFSNYSTPKFTFVAPIGTEGIAFQDIQDIYQKMVDSVETAYMELTGIYKKVIAIDIKINEVVSSPQVLVDCYPILGFTTSANTFTDQNHDYWYWGWNQGKLNGDYTGQYDAADMLTLKANQALNQAFDLSSYYFTDVNIEQIIPGLVPEYTNYGYNMLFEGWQINDYLEPNEMNYRLDRVIYIAQMQSFKPQNKGIISFNVVDDFSSGNQYCFHTLYVTYGLPHLN